MNTDNWPTDWQKLFALALYDLKTPSAVITGYTRMLDSRNMDATREQQIYAEIKRAAQASHVVWKMGELEALETRGLHGWWTAVEKAEISLEATIRDALATPGGRWDPEVAVDVLINPGETVVMAHAEPLKRALVSVVSWVCGELGRKQRYTMHLRIADSPEPYRNIVVAETADITRTALQPDASLEPFNDYQDGTRLDLPLATRTIAAHGGHIWWLEGTIGARIALPLP